MRVLLISHTAQSRTEGQPRAACLAGLPGGAGLPGVELCVLVPARWKRYGKWRDAEPALPDARFRYEVQRVRRAWMGPAQTYLHGYPGLKRLVREFKPDVIDLWEEPWSWVSVQACRVRNRWLPGAKIVSETEQNIDKTLPLPFERFRRYTLSQADAVVGRSAEAVAVVQGKGYRGPTAVVPNAVDTGLFRPMDRAACRRALGLDHTANGDGNTSGFVTGYVGRLVQAKGIADLIEALAAQRETGGRLVVAGEGPDEPALRTLAAERGVAERMTWLGARALGELPTVMNALDVLVLPSRTTASWKEQFGRVLIEAQACGVPTIGSASGGIPDVVGQGGLVVPERDPATLAAALDRLADSPALAARLGQAGYEQVQASYTWERVAQRMHEIYQGLLGETGADGADEPSAPPAARTEVGALSGADQVPGAGGWRDE